MIKSTEARFNQRLRRNRAEVAVILLRHPRCTSSRNVMRYSNTTRAAHSVRQCDATKINKRQKTCNSVADTIADVPGWMSKYDAQELAGIVLTWMS